MFSQRSGFVVWDGKKSLDLPDIGMVGEGMVGKWYGWKKGWYVGKDMEL